MERASPEARTRLLKEREFLNSVATNNKWPTLFELEDGINGNVQLVFGGQGVDKAKWLDFTGKLLKRHAGATWVEIR